MTPLRRVAVLAAAMGALLLAPAGPTAAPEAQAHPLGNFTVNHYDGLTLRPDGIEVLAVLDVAEIPTFQQRATVDTDGDGTYSPAEAAAHASAVCADMTATTTATVNGAPVRFDVRSAAAEFPADEASGLPTTRVTCELAAPADLSERSTVVFTDGFLADRVGWREITVTGDGLRLAASDVEAVSVSRELREYPVDLLSDPPDERSARVEVVPGSGGGAVAAGVPETGVGWLDGTIGAAEDYLSGLVSGRDGGTAITVLAAVLAVVLGAAHAAMPGHGKTVMAAYLAGTRGSRRDAVLVGATVTVTHSVGVFVFAVLITLVAAFSPVAAMRWLGVISGVLVAAVGVLLLRAALRKRRELAALPVAERTGALVGAAVGGSVGHGHGHGGHGHGHGHGHRTDGDSGRLGLIGMGIAGGLVPSPTALVVLLVAIQHGRSGFGIGLVLLYALGMAATLTAAGLLLVSVRNRLQGLERLHAWRDRAGRLMAVLPAATAVLVLVVGVGLVLRALAGGV